MHSFGVCFTETTLSGLRKLDKVTTGLVIFRLTSNRRCMLYLPAINISLCLIHAYHDYVNIVLAVNALNQCGTNSPILVHIRYWIANLNHFYHPLSAFLPVNSSHRRTATSQNTGSSSIAKHRRPRRSAAIIWLPDPLNGS